VAKKLNGKKAVGSEQLVSWEWGEKGAKRIAHGRLSKETLWRFGAPRTSKKRTKRVPKENPQPASNLKHTRSRHGVAEEVGERERELDCRRRRSVQRGPKKELKPG